MLSPAASSHFEDETLARDQVRMADQIIKLPLMVSHDPRALTLGGPGQGAGWRDVSVNSPRRGIRLLLFLRAEVLHCPSTTTY